ncbi:hypothetical protein NLG97_g239 [Lecanicillium saksenae]|uniref:Uncharacterized protein n=1 Tax=Lecanicillium saksenae TaxID=468837 RepID=A0ACC1R8G0_9HYPO|nr:hypothetical protein NLG97_g239 [Lecanicillium saksenae]
MSTTIPENSSGRVSRRKRRDAQSLIKKSAELWFLNYRTEMYQFWAALLRSTALSCDTTSTHVIEALLALEGQLKRSDARRELFRLVNIRVAQLLPLLYQAVKDEVKRGELRPSQGRGITTIVIDLYLASVAKTSRESVKHRWRISNRWNILSSGSPILSILLADAAETVIQDFSITLKSLQEYAREIFSTCEGGLQQELPELSRIVAISRREARTPEHLLEPLQGLNMTGAE